jgi:hypothetical protein
MGLSERSQHIVNAFTKFTKSGDKSIIEAFNREEIEIAFVQFASDSSSPPSIAMEKRTEELKEIKI